MITNDNKIAEDFNDYFGNIVLDLGLKIQDAAIHHSQKNEDHIVNVISKYQNHLSIKTILKHSKNHFSFKSTTQGNVLKNTP